jgi:hypothetical protein
VDVVVESAWSVVVSLKTVLLVVVVVVADKKDDAVDVTVWPSHADVHVDSALQ